jgi:hypothetical protein
MFGSFLPSSPTPFSSIFSEKMGTPFFFFQNAPQLFKTQICSNIFVCFALRVGHCQIIFVFLAPSTLCGYQKVTNQ